MFAYEALCRRCGRKTQWHYDPDVLDGSVVICGGCRSQKREIWIEHSEPCERVTRYFLKEGEVWEITYELQDRRPGINVWHKVYGSEKPCEDSDVIARMKGGG